MQVQHFEINNAPIPFYFDDGRGDYNRSYERSYDDFDYADYSTDTATITSATSKRNASLIKLKNKLFKIC